MRKIFVLAIMFLFTAVNSSLAHFGMIIPSENIVLDGKKSEIMLNLSFSHPMEGIGMTMERPKSFQVFVNGKSEDMLPTLKATRIMGAEAWQAKYTLNRPGLYQFVVEPIPYWEETENCYIIHYSKTYVSAFGEEEGWSEPLGLKTEILPLTRPFGNYTGNIFQGQVLLDGKPVPHAEIEVEFYNSVKNYIVPNNIMVTQTLKADSHGVFTYAVPFAGWWGFAALNTSPEQMDHEGEKKNVELGAILWTNFIDPIRAKKRIK